MINLRKELSKIYNINCLNYSNTKIGSEILLKLYCNKTGKNINDVKSLRTYRKSIKLSEVIFDYIHFKSEILTNYLNNLKEKVITNTKKEEDISIIYKNFEFVYGKGGIHGSLNKKIISSDKEYTIMDCDVSSLYPSIAVVNKLYPQHLGPEFYEVYKHDIVDIRLAEKKKGKEGNKAIIDGFKEAANASYGNSNQIYSWLYDPLYTMKTTINGQLMLTMLAEQLLEIPNLSIIQINTDGITVKLKKENIENYYKICKDWELFTKLNLEYAEYSKIIIRDVNNYIAIYKDITKKPKCKGFFEFENIPLHKNKSFSIIPKAIYEYFVNNIPIEDTIYNHKNIYDFCGGIRAKKTEKKGYSHYELHEIIDGKLKITKLSKTVRYFISKKGQYLIKVYEDGSYSQVEAPLNINKSRTKEWKITYFNKAFFLDNFENYNIDYSYYIYKAREVITELEDKYQLSFILK